MPFVRHLGKTNMLTEIPQDINLELKDGVLTLKAGSKVYVPNGFEKLKKYYKEIVTTKYWKEVTTGSKELEYACYKGVVIGSTSYYYVKVPIGSDFKVYANTADNSQVDSIDKLAPRGFNFSSIADEKVTAAGYTLTRYRDGDLYKDTTVTETVEGTPEDYTYTTEETETTEVGADDDWTRFEEIDTDVKRFDEVVIESDVIATNYTGYTFTAFACYVPELNRVLLDTEYTGSGNGFEYNTEENYLRLTGSYTDATWTGKLTTLPLGLIEMTSSIGVTSIKQVFNGFGYIDSTVFVLPGVKGLIPDGWNADGSYKNIEFTVANMMVRTETSGDRDNQDLAISTTGIGMNNYTYNHDENYLYTGSSKHQDRFVIGKISTSSGKVTSLTPKKVGEGVIKTKLYQLAAIKRTYYKYEYQDWTQPVATAATTAITGGNMVITASSTEGYRKIYGALDGSMSAAENAWLSSSSGAAWWQVKFPYKIKITGLTHYNPYVNASCAITSAQFFTSSSKTIPIGNSFSTPDTDWYKTVISGIPSEGIVTDTIYFSGVGGGYAGIGELVITAQKEVVVAGTSTDYDYYTDKLLSYSPILNNNLY